MSNNVVPYRWGGHPARWLAGFIPDIPTPFSADGSIDLAAFAVLCERQIEAGTLAILICDGAGEAWTLTPAERTQLIHTAVETSRKRVHVIAGAGSNATARAVELTRQAAAAGADAILSVVPYYNRPMQEGVFVHFRAVAEATALPIILHDCPARTARALSDETLVRLAQASQFVGLCDSTGDVTRVARLRSQLPPAFRLLAGDASTVLACTASGVNGCMSPLAMVAPELCHAMFLHGQRRRWRPARRLHGLALPLLDAFARETPAALKYALSLQGLARPDMRLPLVEADEDTKAMVVAAMALVALPTPPPRCEARHAPLSPRRT
jgi:4-hydroxy-tetrahydrodipicolinate synthase